MNHSTPISTTLTLTVVTTACSLTSTALLLSVPASSFFERSRGRSCGCQSIGTDVALRHDFWRIWFSCVRVWSSSHRGGDQSKAEGGLKTST
jgi:hypothetical protein